MSWCLLYVYATMIEIVCAALLLFSLALHLNTYIYIYIYTCTMHYFSQDILIVFHLYKLFFVFFNFCFWIPLRSHTNVSTQFQIHSQTIAYAQMLLVFFFVSSVSSIQNNECLAPSIVVREHRPLCQSNSKQ